MILYTYDITSCQIILCHSMLYCNVILYHIVSYYIISYRVIFYYILNSYTYGCRSNNILTQTSNPHKYVDKCFEPLGQNENTQMQAKCWFCANSGGICSNLKYAPPLWWCDWNSDFFESTGTGLGWVPSWKLDASSWSRSRIFKTHKLVAKLKDPRLVRAL